VSYLVDYPNATDKLKHKSPRVKFIIEEQSTKLNMQTNNKIIEFKMKTIWLVVASLATERSQTIALDQAYEASWLHPHNA
jgi:sulfate adenylyltransferase subunit 1 (EFTu-like GTPase family)